MDRRSQVVVIEVDSCQQRISDVAQAGGQRVRDTEDNITGLWQALH